MTFLIETVRLALTNLFLHKMRSMLTVLGIIFGVSAVITMVAIGEGNKRKALADIEQLGARNIIVQSVKPAEPTTPNSSGGGRGGRSQLLAYGLTRGDVRRIQETVGPIQRLVPLKRVSVAVSNQDRRSPAAVMGTTPELLAVSSLRVERGRYLSAADDAAVANVAVIGADIAERLFPLQDPLDGTLRIEQQIFRVVGVLQRVGMAAGAGSSLVGRDWNFDVHIPLTTANVRFGDTTVSSRAGSFEATQVELQEIYIEVATDEDVLHVGDQVRFLIDTAHAKNGDATVFIPLELLMQRQRTLRMFNRLMTAIAAISLLVGGIGIMNIMLATVTERTREIGVRRALGATRRHIVTQFLVETSMLSVLGGIIGVALAVGGIAALMYAVRAFPDAFRELAEPIPTTWSILLSVIVSAAVGVVFGIYPAIKAALQDPIVALRHD